MPLVDLLTQAAMLSAPLDPPALGPLRARLFGSLRASGWLPAGEDRGRPSHRAETDEALLLAFTRGDAAAFDTLFERHVAKLNGYACRYLQPADAEDAVQDAFLAVFKNASDLLARGEVNVPGYLFGVLRNKIVDVLATREKPVSKAEMPEVPTEDDALVVALRREDVERLVRLLDRTCSPLEQHVVIASLEEDDGPAIAAELGISPGHLRVVRHRALKKLRKALGEEDAS